VQQEHHDFLRHWLQGWLTNVLALEQSLRVSTWGRAFASAPIDTLRGTRIAEIAGIGGWFIASPPIPVSLSGGREPFVVSPLHGRSAAMLLDDGHFVSIKGVGWTWGGPRISVSPKDPELVFGLLGQDDANREIAVSEWLAERGLATARVLGAARLTHAPLNGTATPLADARWRDGKPMRPSLLYTRLRTPVRVADLPYLNPAVRSLAMAHAACVLVCEPNDASLQFATTLGERMGRLHEAGCINDTLAPDNITIGCELLDFEWFTVPGIPLPDGSGLERDDERRQKEIIYALDVCRCFALWTDPVPRFEDLLAWLREGYARGGGTEIVFMDALTRDIECPGINTAAS
jgi:hypothetical protein